MDVAEALAELQELSTQVIEAVVLDTDGALLGALGGESRRSERLARAGQELLAAAAEVRQGGAELTRVEVVMPAGSVFALREGGRTIIATATPESPAGLVVYDLRTVLRRLAEEEAAA
jgi:predicted regulator of Ras-like GTPase activity (Roadblock/LC7/MglB family)